ncbi:MAG: metallophosphoesterase [Candidatus Eiseniibacteriota bacterium]|jgi:hypothetical protein
MTEQRRQSEVTLIRARLDGITRRRQTLHYLQSQLMRGVIEPVTIVISDPHGHLGRFEELLATPRSQPVSRIVLLGDYMDRGPRSVAVYRHVRELVETDNAVALLGNHEIYLIRTMLGDGRPGALFDWIASGGLATFRSLGMLDDDVDPKIMRFAARLAIRHSPGSELEYFDDHFPGLLDRLFKAVRETPLFEEIARWYQQHLRLCHRDEHGSLFIHAGIPVGENGSVEIGWDGAHGIAALERAEEALRAATDPGDPVFAFLGGGRSVVTIRRDSWISDIIRHGWENRVLDQLGADRILFGHTAHRGACFDYDGFAYCLDRGMWTGQGCCLFMDQDGFTVCDYPRRECRDPDWRTLSNVPALLMMTYAELRELDHRERDLEERQRALESNAFGLAMPGMTRSAHWRPIEEVGSDDQEYPFSAEVDFGEVVRGVAAALAADGTIPELDAAAGDGDAEDGRYRFGGIDRRLRVHYLMRFNRDPVDALASIVVEVLKNAYEEAPDQPIGIRLSPTSHRVWTLAVENQGVFTRRKQRALLRVLDDHVRRGALRFCYSLNELSVKATDPVSRFFTPIKDYDEALGLVHEFRQSRGLKSLVFVHGLGRDKQRPGDELGRGGVGLTGVYWTVSAKFGGSVDMDISQPGRTIMRISLRAEPVGEAAREVTASSTAADEITGETGVRAARRDARPGDDVRPGDDARDGGDDGDRPGADTG